MSNIWPKVRLGEVLEQVTRDEAVEATKEYRLLGVRLDGRGPFLRELVTGTQTSATRLSRVAKDDFIYSRLFAWRGAFGAIEPELDGCYVSGEFPTFVPRNGRIDIHFLLYWFRLHSTLARVEEQCSGSTPLTRNRFKEHFFLEMEIPLPPMQIQRRIVKQIEELASKLGEARAIRKETEEATRVLIATVSNKLFSEISSTEPLGELIAGGTAISYGVLVPGPEVENGIPFIRIQDISVKDPPARPSKRISPEVESSYARTRLEGGEVLLAVVGATIGKIGVVPDSWRGANIARAVCRIVPGPKLDRDFLVYVLQSQEVQNYFRAVTRTLAQPTLNIAQVQQTRIPLPSLTEQRVIVAHLNGLQEQTDTLKALLEETSTELAALMPSILDKAFLGGL